MESIETLRRILACAVDDLAPGESMTVKGDRPVALYRTEDDEFFATADTCTHEDWSLGEDSDLEGTEVVCPLHMARFDVRTGAALCLPASIGLRTYQVEVGDDGNVYVLA